MGDDGRVVGVPYDVGDLGAVEDQAQLHCSNQAAWGRAV
jgi:hypothetical protein